MEKQVDILSEIIEKLPTDPSCKGIILHLSKKGPGFTSFGSISSMDMHTLTGILLGINSQIFDKTLERAESFCAIKP